MISPEETIGSSDSAIPDEPRKAPTEVRLLDRLHFLGALFLILWLNAGTASFVTNDIPISVKVAIFLFWLLLSLTRKRQQLKVDAVWPLAAFAFIVTIMSSGATFEPYTAVYSQRVPLAVIAIFLCLYYSDTLRRPERRIICGLLLLDLVLIAVRTLIAIEREPLVSRYLSTTVDNRVAALGQATFPGIADFGHVYAMGLLVPVLLYVAMRRVRFWPILLSVAALFVAVILATSFTTAIVLTSVGTVLALFVRISEKYSFSLASVAFAIAGLILVPIAVSSLPGLAGLASTPFDVSVRLIELHRVITGGGFTGDLQARTLFFSSSVDAFLTHPWFGTSLATSPDLVAGGHAEWVDLLAVFGLVSLLFYFGLFRVLKVALKFDSRTSRNATALIWAMVVALGFFNPVLAPNFVTVWFLAAPWVYETFGRRGRV